MKSALSLLALLAHAPLLIGCAPGGGLSPGAAAPVANFAACVLIHSAEDVAAGMAAPQIVVDLIGKCGGDTVAVATVLEADVRAHETGGSGPAFAEISRAARKPVTP